MEDKKRLIGIDLLRGIAAYAVVLLHCGDQTWAPVENGAAELRNFFNFAVPFFLALSFYLATRKFYLSNFYSFIPRIKRILIPYLSWTVFYLVFKSLSFIIFEQPDKLSRLLQNSIGIIFLGGASIQLYFLPLLLTGSVILPVASHLARKEISLATLLLLFVLSSVSYEVVIESGNDFQLGLNIAFQPLIESVIPDVSKAPLVGVFFVFLAWLIRCLPYVFLAMIINHILKKRETPQFCIQHSLIFLGISIVFRVGKIPFVYPAYSEIITAFSLLLLAISLSNSLNENKLITNLGTCSFGIYLIHPFPIQIIEVLVRKFTPNLINHISITSLLVFSIPSFLISWALIAVLEKRRWFAEYMLGV